MSLERPERIALDVEEDGTVVAEVTAGRRWSGAIVQGGCLGVLVAFLAFFLASPVMLMFAETLDWGALLSDGGLLDLAVWFGALAVGVHTTWKNRPQRTRVTLGGDGASVGAHRGRIEVVDDGHLIIGDEVVPAQMEHAVDLCWLRDTLREVAGRPPEQPEEAPPELRAMRQAAQKQPT